MSRMKYPCWIRITYDNGGMIKGLLISASNGQVLFDKLDRANINEKQVCFATLDDQQMSEQEIESLFIWIDTKRRLQDEQSERKEKSD